MKNRVWSACLMLVLSGSPFACSAKSAAQPTGYGGGPNGGGGPGGSAPVGGSGGLAGSGVGALGGLGATGNNTGGTAPVHDACATSDVIGDPVELPADIIWVVDQSGSMDQETQYVQTQINNFVAQIGQSNIDYRVVMIAASTGENAICVPEPLSGGSCGNGPRFRLVNVNVDSWNALALIIEQYPQYADFLRPNSFKHFVIVTDDNAWLLARINSAQQFTSALASMQPPDMFRNWKLHAIYSYGPDLNGCNGPFGAGFTYGTVYEELVRQTGGAQGQICVDNWQPVFDAITTAVITGAKVSCEYPIPPPPDGGTLNPNEVNVDYLPGGNPPAQPIFRVNQPGECTIGVGQGGWHYDDNTAPSKILLCPDTCRAVQTDLQAQVQLRFGCQSVYKPPS